MSKKNLSIIFIQRSLQGLTGLITAVCLALFLSHEEQGWYYTFLSLASIFSLFEMGLSNILIKESARIFSELKWFPQGKISATYPSLFFSIFY